MNPDHQQVGFAVVGAGLVGPRHAAAAAAAPGGRLVAVVDTVAERARSLAGQHGAEWHTDLAAILDRDDIHVVSVCLPTRLHLEIGKQVAEAGKHLVIEKPLELSLERADQLLEIARQNNVEVAAIYNRRFIPALQATKRAVQDGLLGNIIAADMYFKAFRDQDYYDSSGWRGTWEMEGGGALINQGIHGVDLLQWIGGPVSTVFGHADHLIRDIEADDTAAGVVRYANGAIGVIQGMTSIQPSLPDRLEFHGTKGSIQLSNYKVAKWAVPDAESWLQSIEAEEQDILTRVPNLGQIGHYTQVADMVGVVRDGRPPVVTGKEGRAALAITLALYESSRTGQVVTIPAHCGTT